MRVGQAQKPEIITTFLIPTSSTPSKRTVGRILSPGLASIELNLTGARYVRNEKKALEEQVKV